MMPGQESKKNEDSGNTKQTQWIEDFKEYHSENSVHFVVTLTAEKMKEAEKKEGGLEKIFKIKSSISLSNMVLFDASGKIAKYNTALDILQEFCSIRRQVYNKRKAYLVAKLDREREILSNKARFIMMVVKGEIELRKRKKADLLKELQKKGFKPMSEIDAMMEEATEGAQEAEKSGYDYLLGMALWSLTFEKVEELKKQLEVKTDELKVLKKTSIESIWDSDLKAFSKSLNAVEAIEAEEAAAAEDAREGFRKKAGKR